MMRRSGTDKLNAAFRQSMGYAEPQAQQLPTQVVRAPQTGQQKYNAAFRDSMDYSGMRRRGRGIA